MREFLKSIGFNPSSDFEKIEKGGSARAFFRFYDADAGDCIFCEYSAEKEENFLYAGIAKFLAQNGVDVPKIFHHDPAKRILIMQDAGKTDLLDFCKNADKKTAIAAYKKTLSNAATLHTKASESFFKSPIKLMAGFDKNLYAWEREYFFENLILKHLRLNLPRPQEEWEKLGSALLAAPQTLVHRDFQSQNAIVKDGGKGVVFIDFQGMRVGSFWYDLGSLLFDPYCEMLNEQTRGELLQYYCGLREIKFDEEMFYKFSCQRIMQALGAYAFLSDTKGRKEYLKFIAPALKNLLYCAERAGLKGTLNAAAAAQKKLEERG
ncbi:MAG: phosphotransferase [Opitutales bacterium]|nr:phosphotransferase [Opitutales bacterium]